MIRNRKYKSDVIGKEGFWFSKGKELVSGNKFISENFVLLFFGVNIYDL